MRTETDGFRLNFFPQRFNLWRTRAPPGVNITSTTDGHPSPSEEERPPTVILTFEQNLEAKRLCEAGQQLLEREERLFGEITESEALTHHQEEVSKLAAEHRALQGLVLETLRLSLGLEEVGSEALTSAVKAVRQEEDQDQRWTRRDRTAPAWRPSGWKMLHDSTLRSLVEERMDNPSTPPADRTGQSSIQADVRTMGRQLKEDLLRVVTVVKSCYPPESGICDLYAGLYHRTFSARLRKITDFGLGDKDCTCLLLWVNKEYPQILQKPELTGEIDVEALGKLLPEELLKPLEDQYLSKQQEKLTTYIHRVLEGAKQKWNEGEEQKTEDGCFVSYVSYDIIQCINSMVTSAEEVVGDLQKAQEITCQLKDFMQRFTIFQNDVIKQNKPNSRLAVKANLGCIKQFRDVLNKERHLFTEDVQKNCLHVLTDMKQSAHAYLLKPVHKVLEPEYRKLGTSDWLKKNLFEKLLAGIEKELQDLQDLQGSMTSCHQELVGQLYKEVAVEYVKRLLKGVKLRTSEQQLKAHDTVTDNAENLHHLFLKMGSEEVWLKDILTKIADVLKLQDLPAIQIQVASLGSEYPDLSEKHVSALLKLKTNLSKADRNTVRDVLSDTRGHRSDAAGRSFFSDVHFK
ncbi:tumor necrosis factor alpha-induced protein 2 [Lycodopsis pacificus]